jgi:hypothetical protein
LFLGLGDDELAGLAALQEDELHVHPQTFPNLQRPLQDLGPSLFFGCRQLVDGQRRRHLVDVEGADRRPLALGKPASHRHHLL